MSTFNQKLAALIAPLSLLAAAGAAHAGPQGSGLAFTQEVAWQHQHAVSVPVADVMDPAQQKAVKHAVGAVANVQRVEVDRKHGLIRAIPVMNRPVDPMAVRAAVSSAGYHVSDAG